MPQQLPLAALPGPYDLIYGFYSIGFHWSLEYYLDDLEPLMHEHTAGLHAEQELSSLSPAGAIFHPRS